MPTYLIVSFDITDETRYADYVARVKPLIARHAGTVLVSDRAPRGLEGSTPGTSVVVSFPGDNEAQAFWDDPDYRPVKAIRHGATSSTVAVFASGVGR